MDLYTLTKSGLEKRCRHMMPKGYAYDITLLDRNAGESDDSDHLSQRMITEDNTAVYVRAKNLVTGDKCTVGRFILPRRCLYDKWLFLGYAIVGIKSVLSNPNFKLYLP